MIDGEMFIAEITGNSPPTRIEKKEYIFGNADFWVGRNLMMVNTYGDACWCYSPADDPWNPEFLAYDDYWANYKHRDYVLDDDYLWEILDNTIIKYRYSPVPHIEMGGWTMRKVGSEYRLTGMAQLSSYPVLRVEVMNGEMRTGILFTDDGIAGDAAAGDGVYTLELQFDGTLPAGKFPLVFSVLDNFGRMIHWPDLEVDRTKEF